MNKKSAMETLVDDDGVVDYLDGEVVVLGDLEAGDVEELPVVGDEVQVVLDYLLLVLGIEQDLLGQHVQEDGEQGLVGDAVGVLGGVAQLEGDVGARGDDLPADGGELVQVVLGLQLVGGVGGQDAQQHFLVGRLPVEGHGDQVS